MPALIPALVMLLALAANQAPAAPNLAVSVLDRDAEPVPGVVVYALPETLTGLRAPAPAVMNQRDHAFVPHILVVETGTLVEFPNVDTVSHHVYSFSAAKRFELPLYRGNVHAPLLFDRAGIVTLGCNIHDDMLGYIFVVDTPYHALTDRNGQASFASLPPGSYSLRIWTPRVRAEQLPAQRVLELAADERPRVEFRFESKLSPAHSHDGGNLLWKDY